MQRSARAATATSAGVLVAGRYQLDRRLGVGGSCEVWAARDVLVGRDVAIKLVRDEHPPAWRGSLIDEAHAAAKVHHRNVIAVFDCGISDSVPYLTMELTDGRTLRSRLREGRLAVTELERLASDLLHALAAVHDAGLAHGDVKPMNVLRGADGGWKLTDFGAAGPLAPLYGVSELEATVVGTRGYLAPERLAGRRASAASDLYAAAVTLYEAAAGHRPLPRADGSDPTDPVARTERSEAGPPLVEVGRCSSAARRAFLEALRPALAADPTQRPPSARALACSIRRAVRGAYGADGCPTALPRAFRPRPTVGSAGPVAPRRLRRTFAVAAMVVAAVLGAGWVATGDPEEAAEAPAAAEANDPRPEGSAGP